MLFISPPFIFLPPRPRPRPRLPTSTLTFFSSTSGYMLRRVVWRRRRRRCRRRRSSLPLLLQEERPRSRKKGGERPRSRKGQGGGGGGLRDGPRPRALVIDGQALSLATDPCCRAYFAELAMECSAVVCCRVSPDQKRAVSGVASRRRFFFFPVVIVCICFCKLPIVCASEYLLFCIFCYILCF